MKTEEGTRIVQLWGTAHHGMERVYDCLMDGKSELAAVLLKNCMSLHNGQQRELLVETLRGLEEYLVEAAIPPLSTAGEE